MGCPLIIHVIAGRGNPFTLHSNTASSSSEVLMSSGGLPSRQNGVATTQNSPLLTAIHPTSDQFSVSQQEQLDITVNGAQPSIQYSENYTQNYIT